MYLSRAGPYQTLETRDLEALLLGALAACFVRSSRRSGGPAGAEIHMAVVLSKPMVLGLGSLSILFNQLFLAKNGSVFNLGFFFVVFILWMVAKSISHHRSETLASDDSPT